MSDHLPECRVAKEFAPSRDADLWVAAACICPALRACEQRVRSAELAEAKELLASRDEAWFAGVEAARDAVAALPEYRMRDTCLAAIDALKEKP